MTTHIDGGAAFHPLVSTLLGKTHPPHANFKYDREEMLRIRATSLSNRRPENLSTDFNGEDGKFSPFKWLEYRWEVEGIKNRLPKKIQDSLSAGAMDETAGLSPQRRGFSGGCKAPADTDRNKEGHNERSGGERLGGGGKNWRNGSTGGSDKFANAKSSDFKLPFQKASNQERGVRSEWRKDGTRNSATGSSKFGFNRRDERGGSVSGSEKLPEWADGPTTMDDMIELRGFDEPKKPKKKGSKGEKKEKDSKSNPNSNNSTNPSRPSSVGLSNNKGNVERIGDSAIESAEIAFSSGAGNTLPASDHELAALLGFDISADNTKKEISSENAAPVGGSRLSRFFRNSSSNQLPVGAHNENKDEAVNPLLAQILSRNAMTGQQSPTNSANGVVPAIKGSIRLEDIERGYTNESPRPDASSSSRQAAKGNPLQDPMQQAQLFTHLRRLAKQQEDSGGEHKKTSPIETHANIGAFVGAQSSGQQYSSSVNTHQVQPIDVNILARFAANPQLINMHVDNQLQQAIAAATMANNGQPIPPQLREHLQVNALRSRMILEQHAYNYVLQHQQHNKRAPTMIPSSVQRQLNKTSASTSEDTKKEKGSNRESPAEVEHESSEAAMMKKLQMHSNYQAMMSAMQGGMGLAAWRQPAPGNVAISQNVQMLLAQQQANAVAQAQMRQMLMNKQGQTMMAKLFQHQQQQNAALAPGAERGMNPQQNHAAFTQPMHQQHTSIPSELSQVGPIQTPLERLLAAAGVPASPFTGSHINDHRLPPSVRPMSLEDLEKELTGQK